jgi:hypothetical protein
MNLAARTLLSLWQLRSADVSGAKSSKDLDHMKITHATF